MTSVRAIKGTHDIQPGESELQKGVWAVRGRASSSQEEVPQARLVDFVREKLHG